MSPLEPDTEPPRDRGFSLVWVFPVVAVVIALGLLWRDYAARGPLIEIAFPTAAGLVAGETAVRFRNVNVGRIEHLKFTDDLSRVIAVARIDPEMAPWLDEDAQFWVVRPEVSARGITGLETVISGVYVEGTWDNVQGEARRRFEGLAERPLTATAGPGRLVRLRAGDGGSISVGAPVFFRQVEVGRIVAKRLSPAGDSVEIEAFIEAPNDDRLTEETRFWFISAVEFSFGAEGARFRMGSLAALLQGGVAFDDFSRGAAPAAEPGRVFDIFDSPYAARTDELETDPGAQLLLDVYFDSSVSGLYVGAAVEYEGIRVGRVLEISAEIEPGAPGLRTRTRIAVAPSLIGLGEGDVEGSLAFMERAVAAGLRAQLAQASLLTGALLVQLVEAPDDAPAELLRPEGRPPVMPTHPTSLDALAGSVQGVLQRIERLPIEAIFENVRAILANLNELLGSEAVRAAPEKAVAALDAAAALLSDPGLAAIPGETAALIASLNEFARSPELAAARTDLAAALASARALAAEIEGSGAVADAAATLAALRARAEDPALGALMEELSAAAASARAILDDPALRAAPGKAVGAIDGVAALLADPALRALPEEARGLLASLRETVGSPEIAAARADLAATLASARALAASLEEGGAGEQATAALAALRARLEDPALAGLVVRLETAAAAATALLADPGLREAPEALTATLRSVTALLDDPATRKAPAEAQAALASLRSILGDLERRGTAAELTRTIEAARELIEDPAFRRLSAEAADTAAALRAILAAPGATDMPAAAARALASTAELLDRIREADLAGGADRALASVESASAAIARAAEGAPLLVSRISQLAARADAILASIDVGSELNYEAVAAIREIRDAARAVADLADLVERRPNALILGK